MLAICYCSLPKKSCNNVVETTGNPNKKVTKPEIRKPKQKLHSFLSHIFLSKCCDLSLLIIFGEAIRVSILSYDCVRGRIDDASLYFLHFRLLNGFLRIHIREEKQALDITQK
jgi:hypothetical protein